MLTYSINDLENLTGVKAHTLRIWEKRYGIIKPQRTESNIRFYRPDDLELILNISFLNRNGYKISAISKLSIEEINNKVSEICKVDHKEEKLTAMSLAMLELDEFKFNMYLDHYIENKGLEDTMNEIIYPFLDKMAHLWELQKIKSVHESFITQIFKRKVQVEIDKLSSNGCPKKKMMIFLSESENQELSFLYIHYILKKYGIHIVNLGIGVSPVEAIESIQVTNCYSVLTIMTGSDFATDDQGYSLLEWSKALQSNKLYIVGAPMNGRKIPSNIKFLTSIPEIKKLASSYSC